MQDEMFWLALAAVAAAICGGLLLMRCRVFRAEKPRAPQRPRPERIAARKSAPRPSAGRADPPPPPPSVVAVPAAVALLAGSGATGRPLLILQRIPELERGSFRRAAASPAVPVLPWAEALASGAASRAPGSSPALELLFPDESAGAPEALTAVAYAANGRPMGEALSLPCDPAWFGALDALRQTARETEPAAAAATLAWESLNRLEDALRSPAEGELAEDARKLLAALRCGTGAPDALGRQAERFLACLGDAARGDPPPAASAVQMRRDARIAFFAASAALAASLEALPWERSVALLNRYVASSAALLAPRPDEARLWPDGTAEDAARCLVFARRLASVMDAVVSGRGARPRYAVSLDGGAFALWVRDPSCAALSTLREQP